jgi:hypothetical protein
LVPNDVSRNVIRSSVIHPLINIFYDYLLGVLGILNLENVSEVTPWISSVGAFFLYKPDLSHVDASSVFISNARELIEERNTMDTLQLFIEHAAEYLDEYRETTSRSTALSYLNS